MRFFYFRRKEEKDAKANRLTRDNFGGTWLSDYVPNRLGGFEGEIPDEDFDEDCNEGMGMSQ